MSSAVSTASAYTPNTTVVVMGEKPQRAAYTAYSGVGALEPARKATMIEASR